MKRDGDIASLFRKHAAKKQALAGGSSSPDANQVPNQGQEGEREEERVIEEVVHHMPSPPPPPPALVGGSSSPDATQVPNEGQEGQREEERVIEEVVHPMPSPPPPAPPSAPAPPTYDVSRLPYDPGERKSIASYHANDHDAIRRAYIMKGPFQPYAYEFPRKRIGGRERSFNVVWFHYFPWVEYSIKKDAVFCFVCYLFKSKESKGKGTNAFTSKGWKCWNKGEESLMKHARSMAHKAAQEKYLGFTNPNVAIDNKIEKWSDEDLHLYKIRLTYSLRCLRFLLHQGLAFRGHDESEDSSNRGNFIEILKFLAANSEEVNKYVLNNAPGNCTLTCPNIQKQIIQCCAMETRKKIIEEIGEEPFAILADESSDISHKEQLALCLRYIDALGRPCEHFIGVSHVDDTTSLSLKDAIEASLVSHGLNLTRIRGQGYDGASNMRGDIRGLKTLIMQESPSAYYIHCFAHQLQLVLVAVAKGNNDCVWFFDQVSILLNIVGVSCKRHAMLRDARIANLTKLLGCGELETGRGLNQEMGLPRPGETRWGSHYKTVCSIIGMYPIIRDVLVTLGEDTTCRSDWTKIHCMLGAFESFDFVFGLHLMSVILGYTNELSECLQRREQDILNAISLVNVAKKRMQQLRDDGWDQFLERITLFCNKYDIHVPDMFHDYVPYGRSTRFFHNQTNDDHFRREIYIGVIDQISLELDSRFDEVNLELLSCMSAFDPSNSFASYDAQKVRRLAEFYPNDLPTTDLVKLNLQVDNYIDIMRKESRFKDIKNIVDLSAKLVETKRHKVFDVVYLLLKLVLLLPVATASVERAFSAMTYVKNKLRNKMGDSLLDDCLVTYIEKDIFSEVAEEDIIQTFMDKRNRRPDKAKM